MSFLSHFGNKQKTHICLYVVYQCFMRIVYHMLYVVYLLYAISAIVAIIGALQIYIKMNTGEGDVTKSIMMLIGACLFMIGATILFPAFFGYNIV